MDNQTQKTEEIRPQINIALMTAERYVETHIVSSDESACRGRDYINWGPSNTFPEYLHKLYKQVVTLHAIVSQCVNYTAGDKDECKPVMNDGKMNRSGETIRQIVRKAAKDYFIYGGFAFNVIRNKEGGIAEIYNVDMRYLRSNKENTVFYYSEDWTKRWGKSKDVIFPMYDRDLNWAGIEDEKVKKEMASTIAYFKGEDSDGDTYPACLYEAAIKDCEIERMIEEFHLNDLNNGFAGSYLINFVNGVPAKDVQDEINAEVNEKYGGYQNAGRIITNFAPDKDHMAIAQKLEASNFEERYKALAARARQQIYAAFRCNPNLAGIATESLGFNNEEYESAFKLFNRTVIMPVQTMIAEALQSIYDCNLRITPFSMTGATEDDNTATGGAAA